MIEFHVKGDTLVEANLGEISAKEHAALVRVMTRLGLELQRQVVDVNLAGAVLKRQTGNLARAQNLKTVDTETEISSSVGFNRATAPYGFYHEFGVPHEWVITAVRAKALRFQVGGGQYIFRKSVVHPPLPERSFLRSALKMIAPRVQPEVTAALAEANAS